MTLAWKHRLGCEQVFDQTGVRPAYVPLISLHLTCPISGCFCKLGGLLRGVLEGSVKGLWENYLAASLNWGGFFCECPDKKFPTLSGLPQGPWFGSIP